MASADTVTIRINGRGGHGAMPHETADPVVAAASLVMALQTVVARNLPPLDMGVVGIGSIHGGGSSTVVPTCVELAITVRALKEATRRLLLQRIEAWRMPKQQPLAQRPKSPSMPMPIRCSTTTLKKPIWLARWRSHGSGRMAWFPTCSR